MKFRCPIRPLRESLRCALSSTLTPPSRPAIHARRSFSRLSSNSCATLICGMRLPFGDRLVHGWGGFDFQQLLAECLIAEHLREFAQYLQVQIGRPLRHQQHENKVHRLAVGRIERNRLAHTDHRAHGLFQALDAPMWDRNTLSQTGRAQLFAREEAVKDLAARDVLIVFEQKSRVLEHAFFAAHVEVEHHVLGRQQFGDKIHGVLITGNPRGQSGRDDGTRAPPRQSSLLSRPASRPPRCSKLRSLCFNIWRSSLSTSASIAAYMSASSHSTKMSFPERCTLASIFCLSFSTDRITLTSIT